MRITIEAAPAAPGTWEEKLQVLRSLADYNPGTRTWGLCLGTPDEQALDALQRRYEAAHTYGTKVPIAPVVPAESWAGPAFDSADLAAVAAAHADAGRPLGQLPAA